MEVLRYKALHEVTFKRIDEGIEVGEFYPTFCLRNKSIGKRLQ